MKEDIRDLIAHDFHAMESTFSNWSVPYKSDGSGGYMRTNLGLQLSKDFLGLVEGFATHDVEKIKKITERIKDIAVDIYGQY